jgi:hypothetical protein
MGAGSPGNESAGALKAVTFAAAYFLQMGGGRREHHAWHARQLHDPLRRPYHGRAEEVQDVKVWGTFQQGLVLARRSGAVMMIDLTD